MNEVNYLDGQIKKNESVKYGLESDKQRMLNSILRWCTRLGKREMNRIN